MIRKKTSVWFYDNYIHGLNPDKGHFMVISDDKQTFDLSYQDNKIKYSLEEKVLGVTIDNKLNFLSHLIKLMTKKANQKME